MICNREPARISRDPNGSLTFEQANHFGHTRLDLSSHDRTTLKKIGFAMDAINRWNAFVKSVEQIEGLIQLYEDATSPTLGGERDE